jgi:hypothetical protein
MFEKSYAFPGLYYLNYVFLTLPGRIHGGVHMRNCGVSSSIQSRCKAVGAELHSSLVKRQLKNIQDRNDYHMSKLWVCLS